MNHYLNEKRTLKKLGVDNFGDLTGDNFFYMRSLLDKMDPEVAKKALEQFPDFSQTVLQISNGYKDTLDKNMESNNKSVEEYYSVCKSIIDTLQMMAENKNLNFEERKYIIEKMFEIEKKMGIKDTETKDFIKTMSIIGLVAVAIPVIALAVAIGASGGGTIKTRSITGDKDNDSEENKFRELM